MDHLNHIDFPSKINIKNKINTLNPTKLNWSYENIATQTQTETTVYYNNYLRACNLRVNIPNLESKSYFFCCINILICKNQVFITI